MPTKSNLSPIKKYFLREKRCSCYVESSKFLEAGAFQNLLTLKYLPSEHPKASNPVNDVAQAPPRAFFLISKGETRKFSRGNWKEGDFDKYKLQIEISNLINCYESFTSCFQVHDKFVARFPFLFHPNELLNWCLLPTKLIYYHLHCSMVKLGIHRFKKFSINPRLSDRYVQVTISGPEQLPVKAEWHFSQLIRKRRTLIGNFRSWIT